jgi:hypothetical protein
MQPHTASRRSSTARVFSVKSLNGAVKISDSQGKPASYAWIGAQQQQPNTTTVLVLSLPSPHGHRFLVDSKPRPPQRRRQPQPTKWTFAHLHRRASSRAAGRMGASVAHSIPIQHGALMRCAAAGSATLWWLRGWCGTGLVQRLDAVDISSTSGGGIVTCSLGPHRIDMIMIYGNSFLPPSENNVIR